MTVARDHLPVSLGLALALERQGNLFAAAERIMQLSPDPALRPLSILLLDILTPLLAMGAVKETAEGRRIDVESLLAFHAGLRGMDEDAIYRGTTLATLAAGYHGYCQRYLPPPPPASDSGFLDRMMQAHPDEPAGDKV